MIAGGLGNVRRKHVEKCEIPVGAHLVVLGGPAMLIGLGGGAASSMGSGASSADLDFASVQRGNPEIQRRAQEVIDRCSARWSLQSHPADPRRGRRWPVECGARGRGAHARARRASSICGAIPNDEPGMSPMELWCNESQERYVLVDRCRQARRLRGHRAARALSVRRDRRDRLARRAGAGGPQERHAARRPAARRVVRQGAEACCATCGA